MHKLFNNILVPVTLHGQSEPVIEKAIQLSRHLGCDVHLLHVMSRPLLWMRSSKKIASIKTRLREMQERHNRSLPKGSVLHTNLAEDRMENALAKYALIHKIDLILATGSRHFFSASGFAPDINRLSDRTGCSVLSLQVSSPDTIKNIVLPVSDALPLRKIMLATYLAKTFNAAIHLISLSRYPSQSKKALAEAKSHVYMEKAYQLLRENTNLALNCKMVVGENIADSTLEYARRVEDGLILVNSGQESLLPGPTNKWFARFLPGRAGMPVMTVA